jgi:hypothetical protein
MKGAIIALASPAFEPFGSRTNEDESIELIGSEAQRLKQIIPTTTAALIMSYLSISGSIRPELSQKILCVLKNSFREKTYFGDFSCEINPVLN